MLDTDGTQKAVGGINIAVLVVPLIGMLMFSLVRGRTTVDEGKVSLTDDYSGNVGFAIHA